MTREKNDQRGCLGSRTGEVDGSADRNGSQQGLSSWSCG